MSEQYHGAAHASAERAKANRIAKMSEFIRRGKLIKELAHALTEAEKAISLTNAFLDDLQKSNPGWIGKLCLQNYGLMNETYIALSAAPNIIAAALAAARPAQKEGSSK